MQPLILEKNMLPPTPLTICLLVSSTGSIQQSSACRRSCLVRRLCIDHHLRIPTTCNNTGKRARLVTLPTASLIKTLLNKLVEARIKATPVALQGSLWTLARASPDMLLRVSSRARENVSRNTNWRTSPQGCPNE